MHESGRHEHAHRHGHPVACCGCTAGEAPAVVGRADGKPDTGARLILRVRGLDCAEEVAVLKRAVGPLVGGEDKLAFDVVNGRMFVLPEARPVSVDEVGRAVAAAGMSAEEWRPGAADAADAGTERRRKLMWTVASGFFVFAGIVLHAWLAGGPGEALRLFAGHDGGVVPLPEMVVLALAIGSGLRLVLPRAWVAARTLRPDINVLMVIAVAGAVTIGEWFEAATVTFLFAVSLALESWSVERARRAISALLDLAPPTVRVLLPDGREVERPAAEVAVGTRFLVRPGERIPLDGRVVAGTSSVDQAPITGESVPVTRQPGEEVYAGTINGEGVLEVESTKAASDTTLARIVRMVEEAHSRRARAEQWVERFARIYTPAVIVLAAVIAVLPPLLFGGDWAEWFYRALVLLVIACPCALVISTPVSVVAALAAAARRGVLVKGGAFVEAPARLAAIAFDKTGTLTRGQPAVVGLHALHGHSETEVLARAAALEARSAHPLARAVIACAREAGGEPVPATDVRAVAGRGVTGMVDGQPVWIGSWRYAVERGKTDARSAELAEALEREGRTVVAVGDERHVCGLLAIADTVRPEAATALRALRELGIRHLVMLTGDNRRTAEAIARQTGIDEVHAELLPQDKVTVVERLVGRYGTVAMVGDGVNDAPALARSSVGIAMGAIGSDAAIETADIALMTDDLERLPWLVRHSRRTLATIRQNITFALAVKALFAGLTFAGYATLWGAITADVGASLLVVANALRLLRTGERSGAASWRTLVPAPATGLGQRS